MVERYGLALVERAAGLPVQLCPSATTAKDELERNREPDTGAVQQHAEESFERVWLRLDRISQQFLFGASYLHPDDIDLTLLAKALGWSLEQVDAAANACFDRCLLESGETIRMHRLLRSFVRSRSDISNFDGEALWEALVKAARLETDNRLLLATRWD